jgi:hypothetical protein
MAFQPEEIMTTVSAQKYRVPVQKCGDKFSVWCGNKVVRMFDTDTLPDFIKAKLGIIMNSIYAQEKNSLEMTEQDLSRGTLQTDLYRNNADESFDDIGWQYNKYYYCVVLPEADFKSLQK